MTVKPSPSMSKTAVPSRVYVTPTDESTQVIITPTPTPPHVTKKPVVPIKPLYPSKEPPRTALPGPTQKPNQKPQLMNHIDRVYAYEGEMLVYRVPEDTFYDEEDGSTRNLKLMLLSIDGGILHKMSWIQFDSSSQTIYGLPMAEQAGKHEYVMTAIDSFGDIARDAFEVVVVASVNKPNHEFSITLSNDYEEFENDVHKKLDLIDRIAKLYGDDSADTISISYFKKGSTIFGWSNNTLPQEPCPETKIGELTKLIRDTSNGIEGEPSQALKDALAPEYEVVNIGFKPLGSCTDGYSEGTTADPSGPDAAESAKSTSEDDIWLITIVPAVIFAVVVLIGGLIAFCLYRRCRKGKLSDEDKHTFISKGIPIIFANELDENDKPPSSKTPLIMKDEKPPLPPEYPGKSSPTTQPLLSHAPSSKGDDIDEEEDPPYEPPPPFSSSPDSRQSTPRYTPAYRSPPPYVPP
ncbi:dystroglycan 1-like [Saccoglossus kowalevskii]|uniref:Dystroglycan 1 n=1 Tax=Saccoglossus kowalevskii TaxID=10224 RepID=A0ABM0MH16_SACKO|nr:PREDICTED: dystroglycan-like [Saccoglossus kowalevskii]